ncbi:MAG: site-specific integrase [Betaproteobacteria bacterium]|nr:site-specific integrase [Betaproteobacteria bacterium]
MGRNGPGVEIRPASIRLHFVDADGSACRETLKINGKPLLPNPANLKLAHRLAAEIRREIALGIFDYTATFPDTRKKPPAPKKTFGAIADTWLKTKGQLQAATKDQYKNAVLLWKRLIGERTLTETLSYQNLAALIGGHPWASAKSANNYLIVLRGILALEYTGRRAADNPMTGIKNLQAVKKLPDPLTAQERDLILDDLARHYDPRILAYFSFAFFTGMRPEEIIALRWSDIDFKSNMARIGRVRTFRGSERDGSKTHTVRDIDLVQAALEALKWMRPHTFLKDADGYVFENPVTGRPWHDERSQRDHYWKPALKRLGIRYRRPYCCRHTYATIGLMAGVNPAYIARQLGHTNTRMLFEKYARWIDGADKGTEKKKMEEASKKPEFFPRTSPEKICCS